MRSARAAFVFLTRVPVGGFPYTDAEWRSASAYFPVVGATLGAALGLFDQRSCRSAHSRRRSSSSARRCS